MQPSNFRILILTYRKENMDRCMTTTKMQASPIPEEWVGFLKNILSFKNLYSSNPLTSAKEYQ